MIEVVTVWAPRAGHEKQMEVYAQLLKLQLMSVKRVGHEHVVITDAPESLGPSYRTITAKMQESLMFAILEGQLAYVEQWSGEHPFVMLDADCIVARKLDPIFANRSFEIMLTNRENKVSPIQNGAMYFAAGCKPAVLKFFSRALELCKPHWGGDQEAISQAMAPVPDHHVGVERRFGVRVKFASTDLFNHSNKTEVSKLKKRYVFHFKGDSKRFARAFYDALIKEPV